MKEAVRLLFLSHPTLGDFGCIDCKFIINSTNTDLDLNVTSDETKSLLIEMGLTIKDYTAARDFVKKYRKEFIEADTLIFEREAFL